jgi:S-adenosylmethionine hydrolase
MVGFPVSARRVITLTTDFGLEDAYVGAMKGVILGIAPDVSIVDISHGVPPQRVAAGAHVLASASPYFPPGTVHVAVVDPGVGTRRKALAIETDAAFFVGPDNGLLCSALSNLKVIEPQTGRMLSGTAVELTDTRYFRTPVSATFYGRDVFAPVAAHLARSTPISVLGPPVDRITCLPTASPKWVGDILHGSIVYVDHFGNAITNLTPAILPANATFKAGDVIVHGLAPSYEAGPVVAIVGSSGFVEIAVRDGSAAMELGLRVGDDVVVRSRS